MVWEDHRQDARFVARHELIVSCCMHAALARSSRLLLSLCLDCSARAARGKCNTDVPAALQQYIWRHARLSAVIFWQHLSCFPTMVDHAIEVNDWTYFKCYKTCPAMQLLPDNDDILIGVSSGLESTSRWCNVFTDIGGFPNIAGATPTHINTTNTILSQWFAFCPSAVEQTKWSRL